MKKIAICILIAAMFALQLSGCGVDKKEAPNTPATVETGATVYVPLFVDNGDKIKIDTRTGEYLSRA